jgi:uracil-DNA glycosylase
MTPTTFVNTLSRMHLPNVFNPWADRCEIHDRRDAAALRRANLRMMLEAVLDADVKTMWIARDLGYRGGRRTGVPLTDEVHLDDAGQLMGGVELERATTGPIVAERTAAVVWQVLSDIGTPVMLWNVFPFHPHEKGDQLSNRCHTRTERQATWSVLQSLVEMIRPETVIAIGRDAQLALADLEVPITCVRHPSYGGQREFMDRMYFHYGVTPSRRGKEQLELDVA